MPVCSDKKKIDIIFQQIFKQVLVNATISQKWIISIPALLPIISGGQPDEPSSGQQNKSSTATYTSSNKNSHAAFDVDRVLTVSKALMRRLHQESVRQMHFLQSHRPTPRRLRIAPHCEGAVPSNSDCSDCAVGQARTSASGPDCLGWLRARTCRPGRESRTRMPVSRRVLPR